jgi:hypothetical protein
MSGHPEVAPGVHRVAHAFTDWYVVEGTGGLVRVAPGPRNGL